VTVKAVQERFAGTRRLDPNLTMVQMVVLFSSAPQEQDSHRPSCGRKEADDDSALVLLVAAGAAYPSLGRMQRSLFLFWTVYLFALASNQCSTGVINSCCWEGKKLKVPIIQSLKVRLLCGWVGTWDEREREAPKEKRLSPLLAEKIFGEQKARQT